MAENWYTFEGVEKVDTPALVIYKDRVIENIKRLVEMLPVGKLRPHIKTSKSADVARLLLAAGITKFKCATIAEAEMLGQINAPDVLLSYQPTQNKLERFVALIGKYPQTKYSCLIDNAATAELISTTTEQKGLTIPVFIDLNVGMDRTGVETGKAFEVYQSIAALKGIKFMGLHAYDGHVRGVEMDERTAEVEAAFAGVEDLRKAIEQASGSFPLLIAGGSPTTMLHSTRPNVECSPGTFVFWDKGYADTIPEQPFQPAALVLARVVSLPAEGKVCVDAGYKSMSSENALDNRIVFLNAPDLKVKSHSEEHMVFFAPKDHQYKIGDVLYGVPIHICPTVAMYNKASVVEAGKLAGEWAITARNREITI